MTEAKEFIFTWEVDFVMSCKKNGTRIKSQIFSAENVGGSRWFLEITPRGINRLTEDYVGCFLVRNTDCCYSKEQITIDFDIQLTVGDGKVLKSYEYKNKIFELSDSKGKKRFIKRSELCEELERYSKQTVTLVCIIKNILCANYCETKTTINSQYITLKKSFAFPDSPDWKSFIKLPMDRVDIDIVLVATQNDIIINFSFFYDPIINCLISVLDIYNVKRIIKRAPPDFEYPPIYMYQVAAFISKQELQDKELIKDGKFTLLFECVCYANNQYDYCEANNYKYKNTKLTIDKDTYLMSDFGNLLYTKKFTDVEIRCFDNSLFAHKSILSARSPVFCAMFDLNMMEIQTGIVHCPDASSKIMSRFLEYMYTAKLSQKDNETVYELLMVADKYQVASLRDECAIILLSSMSIATVWDIIQIADLTGLNSLKCSAMDFIKQHSCEMLSSPRWYEIVEKNITLSTNIIFQLAQKQFKQKKLAS